MPASSAPQPSAPASSARPAPSSLGALRPLVWLLATLYVLAVAVIVLWPTHVDAGESGQALKRWLEAGKATGALPAWLSYTVVEWVSNVLMFLPGGFFFTLLVRPPRAYLVPLAGLAVSLSIEAAQLFMPGRTSSLLDVLANSLGCAIGWVLGLVIWWASLKRN